MLSLLDGAVHPDGVRVLEPGHQRHLLLDQLLHLVLLLVRVAAEGDLLGRHQGARLHVPRLVAGAVGPRTEQGALGPVNALLVLSLAALTILQ